MALEELEKDIEQNGSTEFFQQSENQPGYERKRPAYDQYLTSTSQYQKIIKQLTDLLPKTDTDTDDLMSYIGGGEKYQMSKTTLRRFRTAGSPPAKK